MHNYQPNNIKQSLLLEFSESLPDPTNYRKNQLLSLPLFLSKKPDELLAKLHDYDFLNQFFYRLLDQHSRHHTRDSKHYRQIIPQSCLHAQFTLYPQAQGDKHIFPS